MLQIPCPYCGTRDEEEFRFGGESYVTRPTLDSSDAAWADYLFNRTNTKGAHYERWLHSYGCGRWFNVLRDTVSHEVLAAYVLGDPQQQLPHDGKTRSPEESAAPRAPESEGTLT